MGCGYWWMWNEGANRRKRNGLDRMETIESLGDSRQVSEVHWDLYGHGIVDRTVLVVVKRLLRFGIFWK